MSYMLKFKVIDRRKIKAEEERESAAKTPPAPPEKPAAPAFLGLRLDRALCLTRPTRAESGREESGRF